MKFFWPFSPYMYILGAVIDQCRYFSVWICNLAMNIHRWCMFICSLYASWCHISLLTIMKCVLIFVAQQMPLQSLRGVEGRSWGWSLVTHSIKCSTTDRAWTCVPSASVRERTAGCCTWTCWWVTWRGWMNEEINISIQY